LNKTDTVFGWDRDIVNEFFEETDQIEVSALLGEGVKEIVDWIQPEFIPQNREYGKKKKKWCCSK